MLMWWKSAVNRSFFLSLATFRMRSRACDTLTRLCARHVLCWSTFPLVSALGSTGSAAVASPRGLLHGGLHRFVRRLRSYYDGVRLLVPVHHRPRLLAFPMRTVVLGTHHSTTTARHLGNMTRVVDILHYHASAVLYHGHIELRSRLVPLVEADRTSGHTDIFALGEGLADLGRIGGVGSLDRLSEEIEAVVTCLRVLVR